MSRRLRAVANAVMVPGYRHLAGNHCGSTALRNLLAFHGRSYSEEMVFGLGAGACFYYVKLDDSSPSRFTNGRVSRLEEQFLELTEAPIDLYTGEDRERSWEAARAVVDSGRPAILLTDLYYLDHYGRSAHFPGHAVVLAGYDDELAYLSDTAFEDLQTTRLENLAEARHGDYPVFPLAGQMLHVPGAEPLPDLRSAAPRAVARAARQMIDPPLGEYEGLPALRRFAAEVAHWPREIDDWQWCARFNYQVIERRGTGGGNFRRLYAGFLAEAAADHPQLEHGAGLARTAAAAWADLAAELLEASESDQPAISAWERIGEGAKVVLEAEERLWAELDSVQAGLSDAATSRAK
jgi:hypothetical protein